MIPESVITIVRNTHQGGAVNIHRGPERIGAGRGAI